MMARHVRVSLLLIEIQDMTNTHRHRYRAPERHTHIADLYKAGWLLEYYSWVMDASVLEALGRIIADKYPKASGLTQEFFIEMAYYACIWAELGPAPGPQHSFIEAKEVLGERLYNQTWHCWVDPEPA